MITQFHLENFKNYRQAALPPLTLLIGANASQDKSPAGAAKATINHWQAKGKLYPVDSAGDYLI